MEHLDFVLWVVLFPLSYAVESYLSVKVKDQLKINQQTEEDKKKTDVFAGLVWIVVAVIIYL